MRKGLIKLAVLLMLYALVAQAQNANDGFDPNADGIVEASCRPTAAS